MIRMIDKSDKKDTSKIVLGKSGEEIAAVFLKENGYRIIDLNYRCPLGEIDIVAKDKNELVFIEVKTRKSSALGYPEQAVGLKKQRKMSQLALWYLRDKKLDNVSARFDVVAVMMLLPDHEIRLVKNAFDFIA